PDPQDVAIDLRQAFEAPVLGGVADQRVDARARLENAGHDLAGERARLFRRRGALRVVEVAPEIGRRRRQLAARDVRLIERLERQLASAPPRAAHRLTRAAGRAAPSRSPSPRTRSPCCRALRRRARALARWCRW